jgi:hypothetical protein
MSSWSTPRLTAKVVMQCRIEWSGGQIERIKPVGGSRVRRREYEVSIAIGGSFAAVICDSPGCLSIMRVPPDENADAQSFALRAKGMLVAEGWTKDSRGQDRCPECELRPVS